MATAPSAFKPLPEISPEVADWVSEVARLTTPDRIHWFDGSPAEVARLRNELLAKKELLPLNEKTFPDCYLARSHPSDVARVERSEERRVGEGWRWRGQAARKQEERDR